MELLSLQELLNIIIENKSVLASNAKLNKQNTDWAQLNLNLALRGINQLLSQHIRNTQPEVVIPEVEK